MKTVLALAAKDLRAESRGRQVAPVMVVFALCLVFLLTFALPPGALRAPVPAPRAGALGARDLSGLMLWTTILFAGILGFGRSATVDREGSAADGLLLAPVDPAAIYTGKMLGNLAYLTAAELFAIPLFVLFANVPVGGLLPGIIPVALVANIGLAAVGTLFGAATQHAEARSLLLPLLTFPLALPVVLGASKLTSTLLIERGFGSESRWFILLSVFDVVFVTLGAVTFEFVIEE
ncbi:MAG TPA: heme exporter protein CcmB [Actinomycetota bacterium]|nr:heme exporter protein CcmB [Actinomycetota bacterium]